MPKIVDHEERRSTLARAAVEAVAARGLENVKLTDIGAAAGVTTGALAHYFRDRDALLAAAFQQAAAQLFSGLEGSTKRLRIHHFVQTLPLDEPRAQSWRVWLAFCGRVAFSSELAAVYDDYYAKVEARVAARLQVDRAGPAHDLARSIIAAVDGVGICATVQPRVWQPERQKSALRALLKPIFEQIDHP